MYITYIICHRNTCTYIYIFPKQIVDRIYKCFPQTKSFVCFSLMIQILFLVVLFEKNIRQILCVGKKA